jgi:hypothetical protein
VKVFLFFSYPGAVGSIFVAFTGIIVHDDLGIE